MLNTDLMDEKEIETYDYFANKYGYILIDSIIEDYVVNCLSKESIINKLNPEVNEESSSLLEFVIKFC